MATEVVTSDGSCCCPANPCVHPTDPGCAACSPCPQGLPTTLHVTIVGTCLDGISVPITFSTLFGNWTGSTGGTGPPAIATCCGVAIYGVTAHMTCFSDGVELGISIAVNQHDTLGGTCIDQPVTVTSGPHSPVNCAGPSATYNTTILASSVPACLSCLASVPVTLVLSP